MRSRNGIKIVWRGGEDGEEDREEDEGEDEEEENITNMIPRNKGKPQKFIILLDF